MLFNEIKLKEDRRGIPRTETLRQKTRLLEMTNHINNNDDTCSHLQNTCFTYAIQFLVRQ